MICLIAHFCMWLGFTKDWLQDVLAPGESFTMPAGQAVQAVQAVNLWLIQETWIGWNMHKPTLVTYNEGYAWDRVQFCTLSFLSSTLERCLYYPMDFSRSSFPVTEDMFFLPGERWAWYQHREAKYFLVFLRAWPMQILKVVGTVQGVSTNQAFFQSRPPYIEHYDQTEIYQTWVPPILHLEQDYRLGTGIFCGRWADPLLLMFDMGQCDGFRFAHMVRLSEGPKYLKALIDTYPVKDAC